MKQEEFDILSKGVFKEKKEEGKYSLSMLAEPPKLVVSLAPGEENEYYDTPQKVLDVFAKSQDEVYLHENYAYFNLPMPLESDGFLRLRDLTDSVNRVFYSPAIQAYLKALVLGDGRVNLFPHKSYRPSNIESATNPTEVSEPNIQFYFNIEESLPRLCVHTFKSEDDTVGVRAYLTDPTHTSTDPSYRYLSLAKGTIFDRDSLLLPEYARFLYHW